MTLQGSVECGTMRVGGLAASCALAAMVAGCGGGGSDSGSSGEGRVSTPAASATPVPAATDTATQVPASIGLGAAAPLPNTSEGTTDVTDVAPEPPVQDELLVPVAEELALAAPEDAPDQINIGEESLRTAQPGNLAQVLATARSGDRIVLAPGRYGEVTIPRRTYKPAITIDAGQARLSGLTIFQAAGVNWNGGQLEGPRSQTWGLRIDFADHVAVTGMTLTGPRIGLLVSRSTDVDVLNNRFDGVRSDGVNIAMSQRVRIIGNQCVNFDPILPIYDLLGHLLLDGDHPDCIQGWSRVGYPVTANVTIANNTASGVMQGVWFEDYGDGGYDGIVVRGNDFTLGMFQGINIRNGRGTVIINNHVRPVPGSRLPAFPFPLIRPWIRSSGERITMCGNYAESYPADDPANQRC